MHILECAFTITPERIKVFPKKSCFCSLGLVLSTTMFTVAKLNKQNEQTWVNLQKCLNAVQFNYKRLFPQQQVQDFVRNKAVSVGCSEGYFIPSLLTTTAFILSSNNVLVDSSTYKQPLNIFTIFVGYPGTGKYYFEEKKSIYKQCGQNCNKGFS